MSFDLKNIIKALLFSTSEGISIKQIQELLIRYREGLQKDLEKADEEEKIAIEQTLEETPDRVKPKEVEDAIAALKNEFLLAGEIVRIAEDPEGYKLVLTPDYATWVRLLRGEEKPMKLSNAALETLALVAYRQPITRAEIELVRGVSVDSAINKLLEQNLIYVQGQADLPGKPRLYATTENFLKFCGISTLEELPASDVLSPQQITEWVRQAEKGQTPLNKEIGLAEDEKEVESKTEEPVVDTEEE